MFGSEELLEQKPMIHLVDVYVRTNALVDPEVHVLFTSIMNGRLNLIRTRHAKRHANAERIPRRWKGPVI